jgi:hypothetical protein
VFDINDVDALGQWLRDNAHRFVYNPDDHVPTL